MSGELSNGGADRPPHNLRTPGPTPLPREVREALAQDMVNHRGPEFMALWQECIGGLKWAFSTKGDIVIMTASGSGGLESVVVNTLSPGQKVLVVDGGFFGRRWADIACQLGADVVPLVFDWGQAVEPSIVASRLAADPEIETVFFTHNETSTGVLNPAAEIVRAIRGVRPEAVVAVDGISSVGAVPVDPDGWGIDVLVTGSQKAWMMPPGFTFVMVGPRAWARHKEVKMGRAYFDWLPYQRAIQQGASTPWTTSVSLGYALQAALRLMRQEGLEAIFARHAAVARHTRDRLTAMGCRLLADERFVSPTITAALPPEGVDTEKLLRAVRERHNVTLADGLQPPSSTRTRNFRVGHLGFVTEADVEPALAALETELRLATSTLTGVAA